MRARREDVIAGLQAIVGAAGVVCGADDCERHLIDERRLYHGRAAAIIKPQTTGELSRVVQACHAAGIGMVPQGGNTGYCGGATPDESGRQVVISLSRMDRIRAIDETGFTLTVEAGVVLADARAAVAEHDLFLPLSMGSEGSCQLGGNLSTNAGGLAVLRYGTAGEMVLGLEVVLADGRIWNGLTALRKDNTGYDLKRLFLGAEGTLGIISAAVLKLFPRPTSLETLWLAVTDLDAACSLLGLARRMTGDCVTSFEYVSRRSLDYVIRRIHGCSDPLEAGYPHYVLLELAAAGAVADLRKVAEDLVQQGFQADFIVDGTIAENERQRRQLWRLRETIPEAEKHEGGSIKHDISVPIGRIGEFTGRAVEAVGKINPAARLSIYGHIGDGNVHFNVLAPIAGEADKFSQEAAAFSDVIHGLTVDLQGSFSAEHGVGQLKRDLLASTKDGITLDLMRRLKSALDPAGLMNPGKVL